MNSTVDSSLEEFRRHIAWIIELDAKLGIVQDGRNGGTGSGAILLKDELQVGL